MSFKLMMIFLSPLTDVVAAVPTASAGVVSVSGGVVSVSGGVVVAAAVVDAVVAEGTSRRSGKMNISKESFVVIRLHVMRMAEFFLP
jgi:hypothetical protein